MTGNGKPIASRCGATGRLCGLEGARVAREDPAGAFAALIAQQQKVEGIDVLVSPDLDGEIASLRLTILKVLRELDDPLDRAIAVSKLTEAVARVQTARASLAPRDRDELSRALAG